MSLSVVSLLLLVCVCWSPISLSVSAFEYIGCYKDEFQASERDLIGSLLLNDNIENKIQPQYCEDYCGSKGFKYYGVQYGSECWCGNSYGKHGQLPDTRCNTQCVGQWNEPLRCGGELANSVFKVTKEFDTKTVNTANDGQYGQENRVRSEKDIFCIVIHH